MKDYSGKVVQSVEEGRDYLTVTFTDGTELSYWACCCGGISEEEDEPQETNPIQGIVDYVVGTMKK